MIFPGVEITVGDAHVHVIALLDVEKATKDIEELLNVVGVRMESFGKREAFSPKSVNEVIDIVTGSRFQGLAILAHIDSANGVFEQMRGEPRIQIIKNPNLLAVEAIDFQKVSRLLDGNDPNYKRKLAVYQASDNPCLDEQGNKNVTGPFSGMHCINGIGYRCSYFKVDDQITIESLRQCFIDPDVRIRITHSQDAYPFIKRVEINDSGFLADLKTDFHQGLNTILGAKGVGKSLLVEFIRFALDQVPSQREIFEDHNRKLSERLKQYGKVSITLSDETRNEYSITRQYDPGANNPLTITNVQTGAKLDVDVTQIFPVLFLSQNEIIKIAESEEEQIRFIDRFFDFKTFVNQIKTFERELKVLDKEFAEGMQAIHELAEIDKQINTLNESNNRLSKQLISLSPIFKEYVSYEQKNEKIATLTQYIDDLKKRMRESKDRLERFRPPFSNGDPLLKRLRDIVETGQKLIMDKFKDSFDIIDMTKDDFDKERQPWLLQFEKVKDEYQRKVRPLGADYQRLEEIRRGNAKKIEELQIKRSRLVEIINQMQEIKTKREKKVEELEKVYKKYNEERNKKCSHFGSHSLGKLKISLRDFSNYEIFREYLLKLKRGSYLKDTEIEQIAENITSKDFIFNLLRFDELRTTDPQNAYKFVRKVAQKVKLDDDKIKTLFEFLLSEYPYEELLSIQYKAIPQDRPEIRFNVGDSVNPQYELIKKISVGQKCTALLIIALSEGKMPILIDQPEDSVDIRSIWEDMCVKLRINKERRQFIFTTHNSSLAVASDSDKFIVMVGDAEHGKLVFSGALDNKKIKDEVIKYLEGGVPTYKLKYTKYKID